MAKLIVTKMGKIGAKAMLYGHRWQKACIISIIINIILVGVLLYVRY